MVGLTVITGLTPVPVSMTDWTGSVGLLVITVSAAVRRPRAPGAKLRFTMQDVVTVAPSTHVVPDVTAKSAAFGPARKTELADARVTLLPAVTLSVTVMGTLVVPTVWLLKFTGFGEKGPNPGVVVPLPFKITVRGLPGSLSVKVRVAVWGPGVVGLKNVVAEQLPPDPASIALLLHCPVVGVIVNALPEDGVRVTTGLPSVMAGMFPLIKKTD